MLTDGTGDIENVLQIRRPVFVGRRSHRNEQHLTEAHTITDLGAELETVRLDVVCDQRLETRLVDRDFALAQAVDLGRIVVHTHHMVADLREARSGDQPHVSRSDDRNSHSTS